MGVKYPRIVDLCDVEGAYSAYDTFVSEICDATVAALASPGKVIELTVINNSNGKPVPVRFQVTSLENQ